MLIRGSGKRQSGGGDRKESEMMMREAWLRSSDEPSTHKNLRFRMHQGITVSVETDGRETYRASSVLNSIAKVRKSQYAYSSPSNAGAIA